MTKSVVVCECEYQVCIRLSAERKAASSGAARGCCGSEAQSKKMPTSSGRLRILETGLRCALVIASARLKSVSKHGSGCSDVSHA